MTSLQEDYAFTNTARQIILDAIVAIFVRYENYLLIPEDPEAWLRGMFYVSIYLRLVIATMMLLTPLQ